jgi:hypothetical protein
MVRREDDRAAALRAAGAVDLSLFQRIDPDPLARL